MCIWCFASWLAREEKRKLRELQFNGVKQLQSSPLFSLRERGDLAVDHK
jgi:alkylhydroperoxidase family enzyme